MRAALYARVSSEEQVEGYSIDAQKRAFQALVEGRGWTEYRQYIDEGKSARTDDINRRPAFKDMTTAAFSGDFDVLVVHKLDRFSRNLRITLEYFDKLSKAGIAFVSINEQMDFSTPWGRLALTLLGGLAQFYSDNLSQETKKGWAERRAQGLYCGALPFGAMKGEDGVPTPDSQERRLTVGEQEVAVHNYECLKMAFDLATQGKSDRDVAAALNTSGYRTTGTHGPRPFSRDTVKDLLINRFYVGEIPDGKGSWSRARHLPLVDMKVFEAAQDMRRSRRHPRQTMNLHARTYSLSGLMRCAKCGSTIRLQTNSKGRARVYCATRAKGDAKCDFRGTFLDVYEVQIQQYLEHFEIPQDYQEQILKAHAAFREAYSDGKNTSAALEKRLDRLKELYEWGDTPKAEYQVKREEIRREMATLAAPDEQGQVLGRLAHFLAKVADAWKEASQEQRNRLARSLFEEVMAEDGRLLAVKPRPEFEPFFKLNFERQTADIAGDPEGIRTPDLHRDRVAC